MNKKVIIAQLLDNIKKELDAAILALESASQFKFESDMRQEHKYDTRSIEAGYLSEGQAKRVEELKLELQLIEAIPQQDYSSADEIGLGALLEIECNKQRKFYFLSSTAGGTLLNIGGMGVLVISAFSPLGSAVMGLRCEDSFELETQNGVREYKICSLA